MVKTTKDNVLFLQETHFTNETPNVLKYEFPNDGFFCSNSSSNSRGVSIMIQDCKNNGVSIINEHADNDGRFILINIKYNNNMYTLVDIYAPNDVHLRNAFFKNV